MSNGELFMLSVLCFFGVSLIIIRAVREQKLQVQIGDSPETIFQKRTRDQTENWITNAILFITAIGIIFVLV